MDYCKCPRDRLCDDCLALHRSQLGGCAGARGEWWAEHVALCVGVGREWPDTERMRAIAATKVDDLTADQRLAQTYAWLVIAHARKRWFELQRDP